MRDGIPDIAAVMVSTSNLGTSTIAVFLGKGDGTFQSARMFPLQSTAYYMAGIVTGDWNGDGKLDIAAVTGSDNTSIQILLGDGTGNFTEMSTLPSTEDEPVYLVSADLNGDGKPDLVVAHCCGQGDATYLFGNGDGTFQHEYELLTGNSPAAVAVTATGANATIVSALNGGAALTAIELEATSPAPSRNVSAASATITAVAPVSIATLYGVNLATGTAAAASANLTSLKGTSVSLNDSSNAQQTAPLFYVFPGQINYLVPAGTAPGPAAVTVTNGSGLQGSVAAQVVNVAPGIFQLNASGLAAAIVLILGPGGAQSFANVYQVGPSNSITAQPINLTAGQVYLELYGTGIRNASSVSVTVGGQSVPVLSSGAQGTYPGLDQVNIGPLPASLAGKGNVNIVLTADGQTANTVNVTIH